MQVELLEKSENELRFIVRGVSSAFVNSLRRTIIAEVPTMAIEDVVILTNTSPLFDEIIAHRLSLIPLTTPKEGYVMPKDCECGGSGCSKCQARLYLDVKAEYPTIVYAENLLSDDLNVRPVYGNMPIVKLEMGQALVLEAYAQLGLGKDHAKWQPVSACAYKYYPHINIEHSLCDKCGKCVDACARGVLKIEQDELKVIDIMKCTICRDCMEACPRGVIRVDRVEGAFIFYLESTGTMPPEEIVIKAADLLINKARKFIKALEGQPDGSKSNKSND
ncbi:MAG: DNA-directed RNA polymerase subunit D [Candidatus Nezhaarchaeota archaeon]|nr:DNA-directed RNA polymerase subunit D [Candidatus Nezhaarchaeota archaeon]MCX8141785.1 DNA-directed RNA polymerase subunit D [Candidatus Nezhaarchaeota archaeon]MDW8050436.1 DNA-directed RNA polymerase subunit D [Nitrososphaerota archaeon]